MEWQYCKNIEEKYFKDKKFQEGDVVLYRTISGEWKKTVLKETLEGTLFIEAAEIKKGEFIIVKLIEVPKQDIIYLPKYEELCKVVGIEVFEFRDLIKRYGS